MISKLNRHHVRKREFECAKSKLILAGWRRKAPPHIRARARLPRRQCPPHTASMAGSPLKRQRKLGVRDEDGNLVRFPYLRPVSGRNGPRDWRARSPAQKLEYLLGISL